MEIKTSEFFKNIKSLPEIGSDEYDQLVKWEEEKCIGGITINGILIPGWLYWHINHWNIRVDALDEYGNGIRVKQLPYLRDNEWIRSNAMEQCRIQKKGYMEIGLRQGAKSEMEASYCAYNAILFKNTQNVIVGGNDADLNLLKDKIDFGLKNLWTGLAIPRLDKTWRGSAIRLGYKLPNGEDKVFSTIIIRNAADGKNTETAAGTTAKSYIMDEVGKYPFANVFAAAKPAFMSEFGWRAIPVLVGTGGSFEKGEDAERMFYNPTANNFLAFKNKNGKETCLFMSGVYRSDCKKVTTLDKYLTEELGLSLEDDSELSQIEIRIADKEKAIAKINEERELAKKDPNQELYLKSVMYNPLTEEECFLTSSNNIFNIRSAKTQQSRLYDENITGTPVELYMDVDGVKHVLSNKIPVSKFPHESNTDKDAPVVIWEFPMKNPPFGLYVVGIDPYRHASSKYSDSLGAVYVFKRIHNILSEEFQDTFVASYVARPDEKDIWNEQARLLIKYYNGRALCENDEMSFIEYMKAKGDSRYLEKQPPWLKEVVPTTTVNREFGIHRSAPRIREHLDGCLKTYLNQKIAVERDEEGSVIKEILGVYQIRDTMLLEEISKFNDEDNFDRIIAAELAIAMAMHLDPIMKVNSIEEDPRLIELFNRNKEKRSIFGSEATSYRNRKGKSTLF